MSEPQQQPGLPPQGVPSGPPPGWYPDPDGQPVQRWWSGMGWTPHTQPPPSLQPSADPAPAAEPQPSGHRSRNRGGSHWVRNVFTLIGGLVVAGIIISALSHSSSGGSSSGPCTSGSCIASEIRQTLVNSVVKDDSVITKMRCDPSSVTEPSSGTYTENCTASYSDGTALPGTGTVDTSQNEVTFTPSGE